MSYGRTREDLNYPLKSPNLVTGWEFFPPCERTRMPSILPLLLRPIASYCLRRSIKLGDVVECLKGVFVEVAREQLDQQDSESSASRLSVMTGVHRKDVSRLMNNKPTAKASKSLTTRVIGLWRNSKRFCSASGKPRVLSVEGKDSDFVGLVQAVSADLNPYTVLFELERIGAVIRTRQGLKLISRLYDPKGDTAAGFSLLASDVNDLMESVQENLEREDRSAPPNLHIKTEYDNIPASRGAEIREWCLKEGSAFHQRVRNYLSELDRDVQPTSSPTDADGTIRVAVGAFSRIEILQCKEKN